MGSSTETEPETLESIRGQGPLSLAITVIVHPNLERIGDRAFWGAQKSGEIFRLGRREPGFAPPRRGSLRPLDDRRLSRRGLLLRATGDNGLEIDASEWSNSVQVDGRSIEGSLELTPTELEHGISLVLARRIVLWLHRCDPLSDLTDGLGLVGESTRLVRVRNEIPAVAKASFPVLIRGETGTGKELVAQAIARHPSNPRRASPLVVRNMSTISHELAAAELFGAAPGAYSGQKGERRGAFREAAGGTLFLDEIGDTAAEVQPMLLRALETGEIVPLGAAKAEKVNVRVLAATDLNLEDAVASQRFRSPLRHRLAAYEIRVPPLRTRRDDLGRLMIHFLHLAFAEIDETAKLKSRFHDFPWLPASWVAELLAYSWPGNVRQLQNVMRRWVVALAESRWQPDLRELVNRVGDLARVDPPPDPSAQGVETKRAPSALEGSEVGRQPAEISRQELVDALDSCRWTINKAAERLGIGRTSIYELMRRHGLRTTRSLSRQEVEDQLAAHGDDLELTARALGVSRPGLVARMTQLGLR